MILGVERGAERIMGEGGKGGRGGYYGNCSLKHTAGPHGNQGIEFAMETHTGKHTHPCMQTRAQVYSDAHTDSSLYLGAPTMPSLWNMWPRYRAVRRGGWAVLSGGGAAAPPAGQTEGAAADCRSHAYAAGAEPAAETPPEPGQAGNRQKRGHIDPR